jgi:glycosyltransferase involved in cell wall biosynthesis
VEHLRAARDFSALIRAEAERVAERRARKGFRYGFVGNIANNSYLRAVSLRKFGLAIDVICAPGDSYVMSQPGWEEFDGVAPDGAETIDDLKANGVTLPEVPGTYEFDASSDGLAGGLRGLPSFVRLRDYLRYRDFLVHLPTLTALQQYDGLLVCQLQFLAYLSGKDYLTTQFGGDIWYECSRDDLLGRIQRSGFAHARAFLVSNPWSFAHARRFALRNLVYVPLILDEETYAPGDSRFREEWRQRTRGSFFVLSTARLDDTVKGSAVGLLGFAAFAKEVAEARLVLVGWGSDKVRMIAWLRDLGIAERTLVLPLSGKRRLIAYLRAGDCLLDQFVLGYYGATALEAMAVGLPVIMRLERAQYAALCDTGAPPVLEASTPEDVCKQLRRLYGGQEHHKDLRRDHRTWFLQNHSSSRWASVYRSMLTAVAVGHRFRYRGSPLSTSLTAEEVEYQAAELQAAPTFPHYT